MPRIIVVLLAETDRIECFIDRERDGRVFRKSCPFVCAALDVDGEIAVAVHDEHEVHAAIFLKVLHRRGVTFKMILIALILQHQQIAPLCETESALFAPFHIEEDRVSEVDQLVIRRSFEPEETAEHKSAFERADFTLYFAVAAFDVSAAFQLILAVFAPVVGGDFDRNGIAAFFKGHFLFDHGIPALFGRDNNRILAVRDLCRQCTAASLQCDLTARRIGKRDVDVLCRTRHGARIHRNRKIMHFAERYRQGIAALARRKGAGVYAVLFRTGNGFAVHFQCAQHITLFGCERHRDLIAEADVFRHFYRAAAHLPAAIDRKGNGDIHLGSTDFQLAACQYCGMRRIIVVLLAEADACDIFIEGEGIIAAAARKRKPNPGICVLFDVDGNAVVLFSVRIDCDNKIDTALLTHILHCGGIAVKAPFALLTFEHHPLVPFGKAESVCRAVFQVEIHGRRERRQVVISRSLKPEEPAEYKAAFKQTDFTLHFGISTVDILCAFQSIRVPFKDDLRGRLCREEHIVVESPIYKAIDRNIIQPRCKPRERDLAVFVRRRFFHLVATRKGDLCVCKRILRAVAINRRNERLFARGKRLEHRFHRNVTRDLILRDLDICLLYAAFRIDAQRGIHIIMNVIARDSDAVDAEFF